MENTKWVFDPTHSNISFKIKHLMIAHIRGNFNVFEGDIIGNEFDTSEINVKIDSSSINTNNIDRDTHLKSNDFFDVVNYPTIIFKSKHLTKIDALNYTLKGNITIKDITKEIDFDLIYTGKKTDPWGNKKLAIELQGKLNRKDFGISFNANLADGGFLIGDEVNFFAEIELVKG